MMPKAALALLLCVASSDAWFLYKAPGGVEFNASGHRSQYLALASRTVGVKGRVVAGLSDASRYFSVLAGGGKGDRRNAKPVVLARGGQWPHADPSVAVAWTGCRTLDMRDGCLAPKEGIAVLNDTDLAHNLAVFRARGAYWAIGGRHRRGDPAGGVFVLGPADAVDALGAAPRTLAFRGDHAGCVERRPNFAPVCEFDGRFSVALSGDRLLLYARANVKGAALNASLRDSFGGRRVQATETVLDERFPRASTWAPFRPVTFLGVEPDAQIYFPAAQGNPLDGGRTVLGLFPVQAGDAAFVAFAVSCDGYAFSPLEKLVPSRVAAFGRGADHPAAGAFRVPVDLKHVREVFRVYIHHDVPGADGGGDWRTRRKAARRKRRRKADEDFYAHSRLASYDLAVDAVRASLNAGTAALVAAGACGIGSDALLSVRRTAKRCRYPNLPTAPGACKFNLLHGVSYVPRRAWLDAVANVSVDTWRRDKAKLFAVWRDLEACAASKRCGDAPEPNLIALPNHGVASGLKHALASAWRSFLAGVPVAYASGREKWLWADDDCGGAAQSCFLRRLPDAPADPEATVTLRWDDGEPDRIRDTLWRAPHFNSTAARHGQSRFDPTFGEWFLKKHGSLALMAAVADYFVEDLDVVEAKLTPLLPAAFFPAKSPAAPRCVAVHVRHGDSCGRASGYAKLGKHAYARRRSCPPLRDYLGAAAHLAAATGFRDLFVATDDVEVAETVVPLAANLGLSARLLPINRTKYGEGNAQGANRHADLIEERGDLDRAVAAREVYADVLGLARCDAIVGPFHSTMDLLVFELQTARLGCVRFVRARAGRRLVGGRRRSSPWTTPGAATTRRTRTTFVLIMCPRWRARAGVPWP